MDTHYIRQRYLERPSSQLDWSFGRWFNAAIPVKHDQLENMSMGSALAYILDNKLNTINELDFHLTKFNRSN